MNNEKTKKVVFTKEIDSALTGYALGASFMGIGIFLLLKPDYFSAPLASYIVGAIIGLFGTFGVGVELSKSSKIKGIDNIAFGILFGAGWLLCYIKIRSLVSNIISLILLFIGCYAIFLGLFQGVYSILNNIKNSNQREKDGTEGEKGQSTILSQIILFMTQLCGLGLAIVNIIKALNT